MIGRMYTVKELADETTLRRAAGKVLNPGPWKHEYHYDELCAKCRERCWDRVQGITLPKLNEPCPVPDPAKGSLADIAEALLRKVMETPSGDIALHNTIVRFPAYVRPMHVWWWFSLKATPAERIICCLIALGKAKVEP